MTCNPDNGPCLGWREGPSGVYQWLHYNEALLRARNFGAGLVTLGLEPGPKTYVGIYCQNCPEWILTEQGLYSQSMVIVPLYDTLGPESCNFILNTSQCSRNLQLNLTLLNLILFFGVFWYSIAVIIIIIIITKRLIICFCKRKLAYLKPSAVHIQPFL